MFTNDELKAIRTLIQRANITGQEALTVAVLLQKIEKGITPEEKKEEKK